MGNPQISKFLFIFILTTVVYIARYSGLPSSKSFEIIGTQQFHNVFRSLSQANINSACNNGQITANLTFTSSDIAAANNANQLLQGIVPGNPLKPLLLGYTKTGVSSDTMAYVKAMIPAIAPWVVLLLVSIFGCCGCCCNWCCIHCYEDYFIYSCRCCKKPKNQNKKWALIIISTLLMVGVIASSIAGLVFANKIYVTFQSVNCGLVSSLEYIINGNTNYNFIGIATAIPSLQTISNNVQNTLNSLTSVSTSTSSYISGNATNLNNGIQTFYNAYKSMTVAGSDYNNAGQFSPDMITNLGTCDKTSTVCGSMLAEVSAKNKTSIEVSIQLQTAINNIMSNPTLKQTIVSATQSAVTNLQNMNTQMTNAQTNLLNYLNTVNFNFFYLLILLILLIRVMMV